MPGSAVTIDHIRAAARRIAPYVHRTPVLSSRLINAEAGCDILFKCENLQKVGAFKARGAHNAVLCLTREQLARGVATHSSGNHAAALALAASHFGVPAYIVMPENAPASKVAAVRAYGGAITFCESTQAARESTLQDLCARTGASFIPPYDHADVIAGQGTTALELAQQLDPAPDFLLTPVGGGGLLAGCAVASQGAAAEHAGDRRRAGRGGRRPAQLQVAPVAAASGPRHGGRWPAHRPGPAQLPPDPGPCR